MKLIKLNLRSWSGYHPSDPDAYTETFVNVDRIAYYYPDPNGDLCKTSIAINEKEFKCKETVDEITEKITLAEIADSVK